MALKYKIDILAALKEAGFNSYKIRTDNLLSQGCLQSLRSGKPISWANIEALCRLLKCQPGDILEYIED